MPSEKHSRERDSRPAADSSAAGSDPSHGAGDDFVRLFADLKLPPVPDLEALMMAHRRNLEALSAANRVALEGAQAVARRHMEIMQQMTVELTESLRALAAANAPQEKAAKQADLLKQAYERAVANTKELSELIQKSSGEALSVLNRRFAEAMDEIKALVAAAKKAG